VSELAINLDLPLPTYEKLKLLAESEFNGNFDFTVKHLIDFYFGLCPLGHEAIENELGKIHDEIALLKQQDKQAKPKTIKMGDGRVRHLGGVEDGEI